MEPSKDAIAVRVTRLNRQITGKLTAGTNKISKKLDRETLLDALTVLYDECNDDPVKKTDELVKIFVDKYRSALAELRSARVSLSDFEVLQTIGRGHFGEVHMVREKHTGDVYALKSIRKEQARKRVTGSSDERDILATSSGQWIPKLQYAFQDNSNLFLVMELCIGGDLEGFLARCSQPLSERDAGFYVAEVAHALKALHGMGFVHRDVKPSNILIDRCGHIKLGDFGSCARLSEGGCVIGGTADYVAPELLAAAECANHTHTVCLQYCHITTALSACDYWSLGVVAYELVTLSRPFSTSDEDSVAQVLSNIHRYENNSDSEPLFDEPPSGPSNSWQSLVYGLLRVQPARRFNYLDTLQHAALAHLNVHGAAIRDQAPPWVPSVRGPEDSRYFSSPPRQPSKPSAAPFRTRQPFAGQLPFVGYTFVAPEESEETIGSYTSTHDSTAIDLATFKSAEKLATLRAKEIASLQSKLAAAECAVSSAVERAKREADDEAERLRARLQAEITALSLQNKRLERQLEVEKEERMALQRTNQELTNGIEDRNNAEIRAARAREREATGERDALRAELAGLEARVRELQAECAGARADADVAQQRQRHYQDSIAKERALRRQTLSGSEIDGAKLATAEASLARECRARAALEERLNTAHNELDELRHELEHVKDSLHKEQESTREKDRLVSSTQQELRELQKQLAQERVKNSTLQAHLQESERAVSLAAEREATLEEQSSRTEARLQQRLDAAEARAASALSDEARHRDKVTTLEQMVRQLEREVRALENRASLKCIKPAAAAAAASDKENNPNEVNVGHNAATNTSDGDIRLDARSDTESVDGHANVQVSLLKEQLERAENQLQSRANEIAALRQEARSANLARWRKEKEYNEAALDVKVTTRDLKRSEERIATLLESRKAAEEKASKLEKELAILKPQYEEARKGMEQYKEQLDKLQKSYEILQAEVDRSRNDIRKLRSEVQYSEKRRLHAEEQEELSARERAQLRDELTPLRVQNNELIANNKALQEACSLLEEQLTDLEKLTDLHELKNKDLESEVQRLRSEVELYRGRVTEAERQVADRTAAADLARHTQSETDEKLKQANLHVECLKERLENRESLLSELEVRLGSLESDNAAQEAALSSAARRLRDLQEECSSLRTGAHAHHAHGLRLQAALADAQEEISALREAQESAAAWWRTRDTKADATIRQQAKLIDFLQAKLEESGRKKCSLSNKLFGRSGRRAAASPSTTLQRTNRELREEVDRLRAKLSAKTSDEFPPTPVREKTTIKSHKLTNGPLSLDMPDGAPEKDSLLIIRSDGSRERMHARFADGRVALSSAGAGDVLASLHGDEATGLPHNEANRAFTIKLEQSGTGDEICTVVCPNITERNEWLSRLRESSAAEPSAQYTPVSLLNLDVKPECALYVAPNAIAIGTENGLHSLRGEVVLEWEGEQPAGAAGAAVGALAACGGRAVLAAGGRAAHAGLRALGSALRRSAALAPAVCAHVLPTELAAPHLVTAVTGESSSAWCCAVACGRRVHVLRWDAGEAQFTVTRSLTVDRAPAALLLTATALYVAGHRPLRVRLPSGALETFAADHPTVAAAAKKHSPPRAILLVREQPAELLLCYAECGVFVDGDGRRTRDEDPRWSAAVHSWAFVPPFLYAVGAERVTVTHVTPDTYRAPPCTCDAGSLASASSDYTSDVYTHRVSEPALLGAAPAGVIIRSKTDSGYAVSLIEGKAAFRTLGTSLESLATASKSSSCADLARSVSDVSPVDDSQESVDVNTGFLADIRKRARQLREKQRKEMQSSDEIIKGILTAEVGARRGSKGRMSPVVSEFDSDSESERGSGAQCTADVCAEMFTRQVRFQ
ncbi:citron rho-interacting kinase-like [Leptidea sinapis]|uniref:citron rho-interacting kinase-like n=1 Tax=Leptidea sinapis TaxID=189913 RepID=UPI0021C2DEF0|nr:citron rho-interacting kinase-like [Leptidea sinapis]